MNKILIEDKKNEERNIVLIEDSIIIIKNSILKLTYNISENINLFLYAENSILDIDYKIKSDSNINIFAINSSFNIELNLLKSNSCTNYTYSTINENSNNYKININHCGSGINSKIVNHGINLKNNNLFFEVNTIVPKESVNTKTVQDNKIILFGDKTAKISPNLFVDTDDIEANHSAYIGDFKKDELFYLETRGLDKKTAFNILAKAFLIGCMNNISFREKDIVLDKIKRYWR